MGPRGLKKGRREGDLSIGGDGLLGGREERDRIRDSGKGDLNSIRL